MPGTPDFRPRVVCSGLKGAGCSCRLQLDSGNAGDAATHHRMVVEAAERIANQVDVLCLAQVSMALARAAVQARVKVPVLTSPATAVARLKHLLNG